MCNNIETGMVKGFIGTIPIFSNLCYGTLSEVLLCQLPSSSKDA